MPCVPLKLAHHQWFLCVLTSTSNTAHLTLLPQNTHVSSTDVNKVDLPKQQPLFFSHQLKNFELDACADGLSDMETCLREGQLCDSLNKLRIHLHIRLRLVRFKDCYVRHQRPSTRARAKIDQNEAKIRALKEKYRAARAAKLALGPGLWEQCWQPFQNEDVVTLRHNDEVVGVGTSKGKRTISWI